MSGHDDEFAGIVEHLNRLARCRQVNQNGTQCARPARWRVNLHGCSDMLLCTQHKRVYVEQTRGWGRPRPVTWHCRACGVTFDDYSVAVTILAA